MTKGCLLLSHRMTGQAKPSFSTHGRKAFGRSVPSPCEGRKREKVTHASSGRSEHLSGKLLVFLNGTAVFGLHSPRYECTVAGHSGACPQSSTQEVEAMGSLSLKPALSV